mgnify:CR=1 FL=1
MAPSATAKKAPAKATKPRATGPTPEANTGDQVVGTAAGVLDYSFGNFKLFVDSAPGAGTHVCFEADSR